MSNKLMEYYNVTSPSDVYEICVVKTYNRENKVTDIVLNINRCVTITQSHMSYKNMATLESVYKENGCNKSKDFLSKKGSVDMVHTCIAFFKKICEINGLINSGFMLKDSSYKPEHDNISLFYSYMSLHGITWYEKHFNARLLASSKDIKSAYRTCQLKMISKDYKRSMSLDDFIDNINVQSLPVLVCEIYKSSPTFMDFFNNVLVDVFNNDLSKYSKFIKPWISKFISNYIFASAIEYGRPDTMYFIKNKHIKYLDKISWTQVHNVGSGGGRSKKNKKIEKILAEFYDNIKPKYDISIFSDLM